MDCTFKHRFGRAGGVLVDLDSPAHISVARVTAYGHRLGAAPVLRAAPEWVLAAERLLMQISDEEKTP